jgi:assimilatory nitrate reductase catalytic subunit
MPVQNQQTRNRLIKTTCPYCGVGCGIDVQLQNELPTSLSGTPEHPANFGRLCVKGSNLLATTSLDGRLLQPQINQQNATWDDATQLVADKFNQAIAEHGRDSVAFYVSGQLLTEDYYVANKLMKGYIGSANIDTNSRLCMSSAVTAYQRAFGEDIVPCEYQDLEHAELVLLIGSNAAWTHPVLYQRIERAKQLKPNMKLVVIDPRRSASVELSDLHLALKPGTDAILFNGLLHYLAQHDALDHDFIANHCNDFDACLAAAQPYTLAETAYACALSEAALAQFFQWFASTQRKLSFYSQGINQSSSGTDKNNAIINCHLATGSIGKLGCGPFSITGQPNAMGGREVGGMANSLTAHLQLENPSHRTLVQQHWQSPTIAKKSGFKAVELFNQMAQGKIKVLWIIATNPMVSMPNTKLIEQALRQCEFVVVSDCVTSNDTLHFADVTFPASTWSEKDGTVTNSERRISRQRGLMPLPGQVKHDWQIICAVAKAMGFSQGFNYHSPHQIFTEYAALTGNQNNGSRALDLSALANLTAEQYQQLTPVQWPVRATDGQTPARIFADGKFYTANGKANFVPITPRPPQLTPCAEFAFSLSSGRIRDQWHSMTRTGKTSLLTEHTKQPELTLNSLDAAKLGINNGDLVRVHNHTGQIYVTAQLDAQMANKQCFVPIHWNKQFASNANVSALFASIIDPVSGQPELKFAPVAIEKIELAEYTLVFSPVKLTELTEQLPPTCHWFCYQASGLRQSIWVYQFYNEQATGQFNRLLKQGISRLTEHDTQITEWLSSQQGPQSRLLGLQQQCLHGLVFSSNSSIEYHEHWLNELLNGQVTALADINALLMGAAPAAKGRKICSCFNVYQQDIDAAIAQGATTVASLGARLKCGTNCGSCNTELYAMLRHHSVQV